MAVARRVAVVLAALIVTLGIMSPGSANASSLRIPKIGVNAPIVKVPVRHNTLLIGESTHVAYTAENGDPPCDFTGDTVYALHAWRAGHGVGDDLNKLKHGDVIYLPGGCHAKVTKVKRISGNSSVKLGRPDGPARVTLVSCWPDNYDFRVEVDAKVIVKDPLKGRR